MASRENQTIQIFLIVNVFAVVILCGVTYLSFSAYDAKRSKAEELASQLDTANQSFRASVADGEKMMAWIGVAQEDTIENVEAVYLRDMKAAKINPEDAEAGYSPAVTTLAATVGTLEKDLLEAKTASDQQHQKLLALEAAYAAKVEKYREELDQVRQSADDEKKKSADLFQNLENRGEQTVQKIADLEQEREALRAQLAAQSEEHLTAVTNYKNTIELLNERCKPDEDTFEVADGKVVQVNARLKTVWLNLGGADYLRPQVIFSVYSRGEHDAAKADKKGSVEVRRIVGPHLAEALITDDDLANPISKGDLIYSPVWQRGRPQSFALAGFHDIDGDKLDDRQALRDLITSNGGVIDAELLDDGTVKGKMTVNTSYLVEGDAEFFEGKIVKGSGDNEGAQKLLDGFSSMRDQAQQLSIRKLNLQEFLNLMGWQPSDQTARRRSSLNQLRSKQREGRAPVYNPARSRRLNSS